MADGTVFCRYELKYLLTEADAKDVLETLKCRMELDKHGRSTVRNIYYDTESYQLIRRSIEKPIYKEKLRIRSYYEAVCDSTVFVELKRKYSGVVYKRRLPLKYSDATSWLNGDIGRPADTQISREIDYFSTLYKGLRPRVFLSYERDAYYDNSGTDFRVTFDRNILSRESDLSLGAKIYGTPLLPENTVLMELKCAGGIPLWMVDLLSKKQIYKSSFSKYGKAYKELIFSRLKNNESDKEFIKNGRNF